MVAFGEVYTDLSDRRRYHFRIISRPFCISEGVFMNSEFPIELDILAVEIRHNLEQMLDDAIKSGVENREYLLTFAPGTNARLYVDIADAAKSGASRDELMAMNMRLMEGMSIAMVEFAEMQS
jgi:hypothetical protein